MGGCQSKQSTNVVNSTAKPTSPPPSAATKPSVDTPTDRKSESHQKTGWFHHSSNIHPEAVYVFKTTFVQADGKQEKVFVNVFHHHKVLSEHCLVQNKALVADKKGENCYAYAIAIADDLRDKCLEEKYREWVSERIVELLNQLYTDARMDVKGVKLPIVKKGYMGDTIPSFSLENEMVSWKAVSFIKTPSTSAKVDTPPASISANPVATAPASTPTPTPATATATASGKTTNTGASSATSTHSAAATSAKTTTSPAPSTTTTAAATITPTLGNSNSSTKTDSPTVVVVEEKSAVAAMAEVPVPRRLTGWMKKQGHVAKNWKTRFFVLDHGFLTYYVDQQEKPPFGVDKKGQVCLAGYRDKSIMKRPDSVAYLTPGFDRSAPVSSSTSPSFQPQALVATSTTTADNGGGDDSDDNEYDENDENASLIQLEFYPQIIDANALDELKRRNGDATFKHDVHKEFLLICRTQQERDGWLAALEAHTAYIENIAVKYIQDREANTAATGANAAANGAGAEDNSSSARRTSFLFGGRRPSTSGANGANNNVARASRHASMALSSQKWSVFLNKNEKVILMGIVEKPNPVGYRYLREMLLVQRQDPEETTDAAAAAAAAATNTANNNSTVCRKRLIYIDSNSYEKKGEVLWLDAAGKFPTVKVVGDRVDVTDINGKQLIFYPKDDLTPELWASEINAIPPV